VIGKWRQFDRVVCQKWPNTEWCLCAYFWQNFPNIFFICLNDFPVKFWLPTYGWILMCQKIQTRSFITKSYKMLAFNIQIYNKIIIFKANSQSRLWGPIWHMTITMVKYLSLFYHVTTAFCPPTAKVKHESLFFFTYIYFRYIFLSWQSILHITANKNCKRNEAIHWSPF